MPDPAPDTPFCIRLAEPDDQSSMEAVVDAAYRRYIALIGRKPGPMLDDYGALIQEQRVHVIEGNSAIYGIIVLIPEGETMLLDNVAVDPACQGRGYGRALLEFAERMALAAGCQAIRLYTNEVMTGNVALYARFGYLETHRAVQNGYRRVFMWKGFGRQLSWSLTSSMYRID